MPLKTDSHSVEQSPGSLLDAETSRFDNVIQESILIADKIPRMFVHVLTNTGEAINDVSTKNKENRQMVCPRKIYIKCASYSDWHISPPHIPIAITAHVRAYSLPTGG